MRRIHVIKAPTNNLELFPYCHYNDNGHNPYISASINNNYLNLRCEDTFKLKPNVQKNHRTRLDFYMPGDAGLALGNDILSLVGTGNIAELSSIDPNLFRRGPQTLPLIDEARKVLHSGTYINIAGFKISGDSGPVYMDRERPNDGHIEMSGPELHIGIPLNNIEGQLDPTLINLVEVPNSELRVLGETNPLKKATATVEIKFSMKQAQNFAATLIHYYQK